MKRHKVHRWFGAAALGCGLLVAHQARELHRAEQVNESIAQASSRPDTPQQQQQSEAATPEARFALALALARAGQTDVALKAYKALVEGDRADLRLAALYNMGNLHLREALKNGEREAVRSLPLIELAKQNYRDLLRSDPNQWDARYNLERALWLAPEVDDPQLADEARSPSKERAITTMRSDGGDLP